MVQLAMGYPDENPPSRPRYPLNFALFEDRYPKFTDEEIQAAMDQMDEGYLAQDYYNNYNAMIPLLGDRKETFTYKDYSWTEHICRKWGQRMWPDTLMEQFRKCGFDFNQRTDAESVTKN